MDYLIVKNGFNDNYSVREVDRCMDGLLDGLSLDFTDGVLDSIYDGFAVGKMIVVKIDCL